MRASMGRLQGRPARVISAKMTRRQSLRASLIVCLAAGLMAGCDGSKGGAGGSGGGGTGGTGGGGCAKQWNVGTLGTTATRTATVEGGALVLRSSNSQLDNLLNVTHRAALAGDFQASFQFEMFVSGGAGAFVQAAISENVANPTTGVATAGIGHVPQQGATVPGISATFQPGSSDLQPATGVGGTFTFQRTGASVTATTQVGGATATVTNASYGTFAVAIDVQMGVNMGGPIAPESSIRFLSFTVTGGGPAAMPDDFGCDSLQQQ